MSGEIVSTTTAYDQEKMLAATLLKRSYIKLVMASLCDKVKMEQGDGLTAYFVRYRRMNVPLATITEATDPSNSSFSLDQVTVTLDEWGDIITVSSRAILTTKHPLIQQAVALLADNAARVMDREIQLVLLAGTTIQYGDGSVTTRRTVTSSMTVNETVITKARITMVRAGAPPKGGPSGDAKQMQANGSFTSGQAYVCVCGPNVLGDITRPGASLGTWAAAATYQNQKALYNYEVGTWLGMRWVETNFIPEFILLGNSTAAVTSTNNGGTGTPTITTATTGGTIADGVTIYWKVTRVDLLRGFEEAISIEHTTSATSSANTNKATFLMPSTAGYKYYLYIGSTTGDANLFQVSATAYAASESVVVTSLSSGSAVTPPDNVLSTDTALAAIQVVYVFADDCLAWVGFFDTQVMITKDESIIGNVLKLKRAIGYKFYGKAMIKDQTRILRMEVASSY